MTGETVRVETRAWAGADELGEATFTTEAADVGDVLVAVGQTSGSPESARPHRCGSSVTLYFPKGYEADLRGARVLVRGRWYEVVGDPRPWRAPEPPGRWWMEVEATRVEG